MHPEIAVPTDASSLPMSTFDAVEVVSALVVTSPKFCRTCGAAWLPDQVDCLTCAHRTSINPSLNVAPEMTGVKSAVALYLTLLGVCLAGSILSNFLKPIQIHLTVTVALSTVTLIWCIPSWRSILPALRPRVNIKWFALAFGLSLASVVVATAVIHGYLHLLHAPAEGMSPVFLKAGYGWGIVVLCIAVEPAVIEELAFRGIIFGGLIKGLSAFETVLVSAMMFMILHLSLARFPHTLALGVAAGYLRLRSRSLYPCILLHFSHNLICVLSEYAHVW